MFARETFIVCFLGSFLEAQGARRVDQAPPEHGDHEHGDHGHGPAPTSGTFPSAGVVTQSKADLGAGCPGFGAAEQDTDLVGADSQLWPASSPDDCCAYCAKEEWCKGFTYWNLRCYLKAQVGGFYDNAGRLSRVKLGAGCPGFQAAEQDTDLIGDDHQNFAASSPEECCSSCAWYEWCEGFTFFDLKCYLKKNLRGKSDKDGRVSRAKKVVPSLA